MREGCERVRESGGEWNKEVEWRDRVRKCDVSVRGEKGRGMVERERRGVGCRKGGETERVGEEGMVDRRGRKGKRAKEKRNKWEIEGRVSFRLLNPNGLTSLKYTYIEEQFFVGREEINIVCLTETKNTYDKVKICEGLSYFSTMRGRGTRGEVGYR